MANTVTPINKIETPPIYILKETLLTNRGGEGDMESSYRGHKPVIFSQV